jgi:mRNA interferase MazF
MEIRRGDLVTIPVAGDYGKPRPALVVQDDAFAELPSVVVLRITSDVHEWPLFRITVSQQNGLRAVSQIMVDKPAAVPVAKLGRRIGHIETPLLAEVDQALARFLGV